MDNFAQGLNICSRRGNRKRMIHFVAQYVQERVNL